MPGLGRAARLVAVVASIVAAATVVTPASATGPFDCHYTFQTWTGGFWADLRIANNGPAVDGWTAHWTFDNDERLGQVWSAVMTQQGNSITATPAPWNRRLATGQALSFGWTASAATTTTPDDITVNGVPC